MITGYVTEVSRLCALQDGVVRKIQSTCLGTFGGVQADNWD